MRSLDTFIYKPIFKLVGEFGGVTEREIRSKLRKQGCVFARVLCCYCFLYMGFSLKRQAEWINRDHSSIIHYKKILRDDMVFRIFLNNFIVFMREKNYFVPDYELWDETLLSRSQTKQKI